MNEHDTYLAIMGKLAPLTHGYVGNFWVCRRVTYIKIKGKGADDLTGEKDQWVSGWIEYDRGLTSCSKCMHIM